MDYEAEEHLRPIGKAEKLFWLAFVIGVIYWLSIGAPGMYL